jgi:hypothetical protein
MSRWTKFLLAIALGIAGGMLYGWYINPVEYVDIAFEALRQDYKTDYVLMTAEAYQADHDLSAAVRRLALLGDTPPQELVAMAIAYGTHPDHPYLLAEDLALMEQLKEAVLEWNPAMELQTP